MACYLVKHKDSFTFTFYNENELVESVTSF
jgi:hypothetical protein